MTNPRFRAQPPALPSQQTGATLIVGLVLLLVLTVIGVSGMKTATMEINMAANTQFQQDAFQLTEDAIDIVIGTRDYEDEINNLPFTGDANFDRGAITVWRSNTSVPDAAFSADEIEAFHFDITAVGRGPRNAQSTHTQSFYVVGRAR